jgi:hypothetical protein
LLQRSAIQQKISNDKLAETVQHANHLLILPTGPEMWSATSTTKNTPVIIIPEMANAVICPDTGKSLKHQELITMLRCKTKWMRSTANQISTTQSDSFVNLMFQKDAKSHVAHLWLTSKNTRKEERERTRLAVGGDQIEYPGDKSTHTASSTTATNLINIIISTKEVRFLVIDINNFYLNIHLGQF